MKRLWNALAFQAGWWACIGSVTHHLEAEAIAFCIVLMGLQIYFLPSRLQAKQEIKLALMGGLLGIVADSALQFGGVIDFYGWALGPLSPFWLWAIWVLFAGTLNVSMAFLKSKPLWITAALGFLLGPWNYLAGAKLGAAQLDASIATFLALGLMWMLVLPTLVWLARKTDAPIHVQAEAHV